MKGICPECKEVVTALRLIFSGVKKEGSDNPFYLCASHKVKDGFKKNYIASSVDGSIVETHCFGSLRPPAELIQEH